MQAKNFLSHFHNVGAYLCIFRLIHQDNSLALLHLIIIIVEIDHIGDQEVQGSYI